MPKAIKESNTKKEINSYLTGDHGDIVTLMEQEWPEMTKEFKRLQREQYELFLQKRHKIFGKKFQNKIHI